MYSLQIPTCVLDVIGKMNILHVFLINRAMTARRCLPPLKGKYPVDAVHIGFDEGGLAQVGSCSLSLYGRFILFCVPHCFETQPNVSLQMHDDGFAISFPDSTSMI